MEKKEEEIGSQRSIKERVSIHTWCRIRSRESVFETLWVPLSISVVCVR